MINVLYQMIPYYIQILTKYTEYTQPTKMSGVYWLFFPKESELCEHKHQLALSLLHNLNECKQKIDKENAELDQTKTDSDITEEMLADLEFESPSTNQDHEIIKKVSNSSVSSVPNRGNNSNDYMEHAIARAEKIRQDKLSLEREVERKNTFYYQIFDFLCKVLAKKREECDSFRGDHNKGSLDDLLEIIEDNILFAHASELSRFPNVTQVQGVQKPQAYYINPDPFLEEYKYKLLRHIHTYLSVLEFDLKLFESKNTSVEKKNFYTLHSGISMRAKDRQEEFTKLWLMDIGWKLFEPPKKKRSLHDNLIICKLQFVKLYSEYFLTAEQLSCMSEIDRSFVANLHSDMQNILEAYKAKFNETEEVFMKMVIDFKNCRPKPFILETATNESCTGYSSEESNTPRTPLSAKF